MAGQDVVGELGLTAYVADWCASITLESIPPATQLEAIRHLVDGYGVAIAGTTEASHAIVRRYIAASESAPEAQLIGTAQSASCEQAAMSNGLAIHAQDFDDIQLASTPVSVYGLLTHPTGPVLGAAAALGDHAGASGEQLLVAYVAGVEVACRIADAANARLYQSGFHSTGTAGAFGATAAAAVMLGLDAPATATAFGVAATMAGGLRENFGTMSKPLHAGQAAQAGVRAAQLAAAGFTAAPNILEAARGFFAAFADGYAAERVAGRLGAPFFFESPGIALKAYASASLSHPGYEVMLELIRDEQVTADAVRRVTATTGSLIHNALLHPQPGSGAEARFSFPFVLALGLRNGEIRATDFDDATLADAEVQRLMALCHHVVDGTLDAGGHLDMTTVIEIETADGRTLRGQRGRPYGHPEHPMSNAAVDAKFLLCTEGVLVRPTALEALAAIREIRSALDIRSIHELLVPMAEVTKAQL
jgi:2-methylcitrate dehydratase PrpD